MGENNTPQQVAQPDRITLRGLRAGSVGRWLTLRYVLVRVCNLSKDLKSKAKENRFFPIRFSDAVREVKHYNLNDYSGERIKVRMENTDLETEFGIPLMAIIPSNEVNIYSIPDHINESLAKKSTLKAFELLALAQEKKVNSSSTNYSYFCAYLGRAGEIRVTQKDISRQIPKYRGGMKFSNAFKSKKAIVNEVEINVTCT